jgi:two-component system, chemotaxis family, sensor kinase CheA
MSEYDLSAYLGVFLDEVDEQLQLLDESILTLEKDPTNSDTIQSIFRAAHTLKGSSAAMGFEKMKDFTHHLENVFEQIRQSKLQVTADLISVIFESIDMLKLLKDAIVQNTLQEVDVTLAIHRLQQFLQNDPVSVPTISYDEFQLGLLGKAQKDNYYTYELHIQIDADCMMKNVRAFMVFNNLMDLADIIASNPTTEEIEADEDIPNALYIAIITKQSEHQILDQLSSLSEIHVMSIQQISIPTQQALNLQQPIVAEKLVGEDKTATLNKVSTTVRVDVDKLEHLMNLVGELVIDQTRLVDVRGRFSDKAEKVEEEFEVLDEVTNHLSRIISELQEGMMKTRMLPIEQLFNRFPRMVRDTAMKAQKEIQFEMFGKETELDRTLIEEISDPIIHLLRNAIDHGIEPVVERIALGKPEKGSVKLKAAHEENNIVITIEDDGRGIDTARIKAKAVEKGLITEQQAADMLDKDAMYLIFNSGLSTAKALTDISGRGVGMDIVKSHIEKLNGIIDIHSTIGKGTEFTIKLPLTLAIIRSLLVKFGNQTFAIPLTNVLEIIRIDKSDIQLIKNQEVGLVRGRVLPLVRMREHLQIEPQKNELTKKREFVVIVGNADKRIGIIADRTVGNQEIVIKSLGNYIGTPPFITGATIMGDGNVALILDVGLIVRELGTEMSQEDDLAAAKLLEEEKQFVTFRLDNEEYGIEIQRVKDIITPPKITTVVDAVDGLLGIINLRGEMLPVIDLRKRIGVKEQPLTKKARIIIVEYKNEDVGFLVDEVTQVLKVRDLAILQPTETKQYNKSKLIKGITQVDERIILILEFDKIIQSLHLNKMQLVEQSSEE